MRSGSGRKWSASSRVFLALAVVLGSTSFLLVRSYAERVDALAPAIGPSVSVVVASRDLPRGTTITAEMLRATDVPSAYAPPGALRTTEAAEGRTLVSDVAAGEAITATRVGSAHSGPVASQVPPGMRAVNVAVSSADGIVVGDHVDVLATFGGGQPHTETPASDADVIGLGAGSSDTSSAADAASSTGTITVLVSPSDAESLAYASAFATLSVSILSPEDAATAGA